MNLALPLFAVVLIADCFSRLAFDQGGRRLSFWILLSAFLAALLDGPLFEFASKEQMMAIHLSDELRIALLEFVLPLLVGSLCLSFFVVLVERLTGRVNASLVVSAQSVVLSGFLLFSFGRAEQGLAKLLSLLLGGGA